MKLSLEELAAHHTSSSQIQIVPPVARNTSERPALIPEVLQPSWSVIPLVARHTSSGPVIPPPRAVRTKTRVRAAEPAAEPAKTRRRTVAVKRPIHNASVTSSKPPARHSSPRPTPAKKKRKRGTMEGEDERGSSKRPQPHNPTPGPREDTPLARQQLRNRQKWSEMLEELRRYKKSHGDCNVPRRGYNEPCELPDCPDRGSTHSALGSWLSVQRRDTKGNKPWMTPERIAQLVAVDPKWGAPQPPGEKVWAHNYAALVRFRAVHGHCRVPKRGKDACPKKGCKRVNHKTLGTWVQKQRALRKMGNPRMTAERIAQLDEIDGWMWDASGVRGLRVDAHAKI